MLRNFSLATLVLAFALFTPKESEAGVIYELDHFQDTYNSSQHAPGGDVGPQSSPIHYDFGFQSVHYLGHNSSEVHASVTPGAIGVFARAYNNGVYAPQRQEVIAPFTFDVFFESVQSDPISVILNLDLSGQIDVGPGSSGTVTTSVSSGQDHYAGSYYKGIDYNGDLTVSGNGILSGFADDGGVKAISTGPFNVAVNQNVTFRMSFGTIQGFHLTNPIINFGNTFNFTTSGDVFTILGPNAGEISVSSVDANIVNNQFQSSSVPEPSSFVLLGLGSLGLLGYVRKRKSGRQNV